jgi:hypothetical protein
MSSRACPANGAFSPSRSSCAPAGSDLREEHFKPMYESSIYRKAKLPRDLAGALECALLEGVVDLAAR